jgi:hypothetical protein
MMTLSKATLSKDHRSSLGVSEIAAVAITVLLIAVQGMFIGKHPVTLNAAAEQAPFSIIAP